MRSALSGPVVHTPPPVKGGEKRLADKLSTLLGRETHLWYSLHPSRGRELDLVLATEGVGAFVIEVKSKPIEMVEKYTIGECVLDGQSSREHPLTQAFSGMYKFRTLLVDLGYKAPWFVPTVAFPDISREDFTRKFRGDTDGRSTMLDAHIQGLIFAEDLETPEALRHRLEHIALHPAEGSGRKSLGLGPDDLDTLISATVGRQPTEAPAETQQFNVTVGRPRKESIRQFIEPGNRSPVALNGLPGSGKTQALIDIAVGHASKGRYVLFVCFNKVLGTKLRQDLDLLEIDDQCRERILVADFFDLRGALKDDGMATRYRARFETVCVDEAQDLLMEPSHFLPDGDLTTIIDPIVAPEAEWFFAVGRDQELYGSAPSRVEQAIADRASVQELRRTRDNSLQGYRESSFAQAAFDVQFEPAKAQTAAQTMLHRILDDPQTADNSFKHAAMQFNISVVSAEERQAGYKREIAKELELLEELGEPRNLMIMLPTPKPGADKSAVEEALNELGVPYLDQIDTRNRRTRLPADHVRLVTVHSSRGLQAKRSIIFAPHLLNFERDSAQRSRRETNAASYIAMSRAMNGTRLVTIEGEQPSRFQDFVVRTQQAYRQQVAARLWGDD